MYCKTYIVNELPAEIVPKSYYVINGDNPKIYLSDASGNVKPLSVTQNSLNVFLSIRGDFKDYNLINPKPVLEVYYNNTVVNNGYVVEVYWRGVRSTSSNDSLNNEWVKLNNPSIASDGTISNLKFNGNTKGNKFEVKVVVSYKGLVSSAYGFIQHKYTPDKVDFTVSNGLTLTSSENTNNGVTTKTYNIDAGNLSTKSEVGAAKLINIGFENPNIIPSRNDEHNRFALTYIPITGVGMLKIDFKIIGNINDGTTIGFLPNDAPTPTSLLESQMYVGDYAFSVWIDKGQRRIKVSYMDASKLRDKRIIFNMSGIFK